MVVTHVRCTEFLEKHFFIYSLTESTKKVQNECSLMQKYADTLLHWMKKIKRDSKKKYNKNWDF